MKCPRCGSEMTLDEHRKVPTNMCYACGYIEGRTSDDNFKQKLDTNFKHMKSLNFNETMAFLSKGLGISEATLSKFFDEEYKG